MAYGDSDDILGTGDRRGQPINGLPAIRASAKTDRFGRPGSRTEDRLRPMKCRPAEICYGRILHTATQFGSRPFGADPYDSPESKRFNRQGDRSIRFLAERASHLSGLRP